ncbi:hypothetical protein [Micromonospora sp. NBC_01813]|uniref:hypothetical protein n=1 Tax=Micromonospora sp. NBC_01813 TaxID=2975988 RepID=UPI002DD8BD12|nr:hypothetical protein [Micromonospora sp. NBC_01813]WSA10284.1 hypothetical protein OG958_05680 [Micromonospora sp. NBC_01813]
MAEPSITYDRNELYRKLSEVQGYFAELRYIDTGLAYLEGKKSSWWQNTPVGPGVAYVQARFGTTFPFEKTYTVPVDYINLPWQDPRQEEIDEVTGHLQTLAKEANTWAATEIEAITSRIQPFTWPVGSMYESQCVEPVLGAHMTLYDEIRNDFGKLRHSLGNWSGEAAETFASGFYHPFEHTLRSQMQLLLALAGGIAAAKAIAESTQHSLMNVVHYTGEALRDQLQLSQAKAELARQEAVKNVMVIGGAALSVFGGILAGSGLWAMTMPTVAAGVGVAATTIPDGGWAALNLRGSTATDLLSSMSDAVGRVIRNDSAQHRNLSEDVEAALTRVNRIRDGSDGDDGRLIPMRPDIVSGVDGNDFRLP